MVNDELFIALLVFFGMVCLLAGVLTYRAYRQRRQQLVEKIRRPEGVIHRSGTPGEASRGDSLKAAILGFMSTLGRPIRQARRDQPSFMRRNLWRAGYRGESTLSLFFGAKVLLAVLMFLAVPAAGRIIFKTATSLHLMAASIAAALFGFYLPNIWLRWKIDRRKEKFMDGFPDSIDLMVVCVEAGMGLDAAIQRVGDEMELGNKIVQEEFRLVGLELRAGKVRRDALRNLAARADSEDVSSLVTLLIETDRFGTSVAQALKVHSDSIREKRYQRAEEMAAKLPVKLVFPLILFIFPALLVAIVGPAAITIYRAFIAGQ